MKLLQRGLLVSPLFRIRQEQKKIPSGNLLNVVMSNLDIAMVSMVDETKDTKFVNDGPLDDLSNVLDAISEDQSV